MKASRLLSILMLLQSRGRLTASVLASTLEVSQRTILRDIDQLSAAGVPLWGERGWQGGFQLRPGWSTQLTGMTEAESSALLLSGLPAAATELGLGEAAASARLKIVASLPAPWRDQAARVADRLHIDPLDWYRAQDTPSFLREAADAVWQARRITVRYQSWRGTTKRELEPLGLVLKAGAWYLAAREGGRSARGIRPGEPGKGGRAGRSVRRSGTAGSESVRTYRLASMLELTVDGKTFRRPPGFDLARYWREASKRFEAELRSLQARVRVSPRAMGWLLNARRAFVALPQGPVANERLRRAPRAEQDGWTEVLLPIESIEHGARQMLSYADEIEVIEPAALRRQVVQMAERVLAGYVARIEQD